MRHLRAYETLTSPREFYSTAAFSDTVQFSCPPSDRATSWNPLHRVPVDKQFLRHTVTLQPGRTPRKREDGGEISRSLGEIGQILPSEELPANIYSSEPD